MGRFWLAVGHIRGSGRCDTCCEPYAPPILIHGKQFIPYDCKGGARECQAPWFYDGKVACSLAAPPPIAKAHCLLGCVKGRSLDRTAIRQPSRVTWWKGPRHKSPSQEAGVWFSKGPQAGIPYTGSGMRSTAPLHSDYTAERTGTCINSTHSDLASFVYVAAPSQARLQRLPMQPGNWSFRGGFVKPNSRHFFLGPTLGGEQAWGQQVALWLGKIVHAPNRCTTRGSGGGCRRRWTRFEFSRGAADRRGSLELHMGAPYPQ